MTIHIYYAALNKILKRSNTSDFRRLTYEDRQNVQLFRNTLLREKFSKVKITKNHFGKPVTADNKLHFNQSHSHHHYALAYSADIQDIGIDIEDLCRDIRMLSLAQEIFHADEYVMWELTHFSKEYWLRVWTIKEAVLKAHGMGIRLELNTINTHAHMRWDFGIVEHVLLGRFAYRTITMHNFILSVAFRFQDKVIPTLNIHQL